MKRLTPKELASELGVSVRYVRHMTRLGFKWIGGMATFEEAIAWLSKHPKPCSEKTAHIRRVGASGSRKK